MAVKTESISLEGRVIWVEREAGALLDIHRCPLAKLSIRASDGTEHIIKLPKRDYSMEILREIMSEYERGGLIRFSGRMDSTYGDVFSFSSHLTSRRYQGTLQLGNKKYRVVYSYQMNGSPNPDHQQFEISRT